MEQSANSDQRDHASVNAKMMRQSPQKPAIARVIAGTVRLEHLETNTRSKWKHQLNRDGTRFRAC